MYTYFKPEIINRIGENIVVFNFISDDASKKIAWKQIDNINKNYKKSNKIEIKLSQDDEACKLLFNLCLEDKPKSNGGRGIGNVVEEQYLNPLAEFIFDNNCQENDVILVKSENNRLVFKKE